MKTDSIEHKEAAVRQKWIECAERQAEREK